MQRNRFKNHKKVGDYVGDACDTCGMKFWASEGKVLANETGLGGAWVCPNCVDIIDYGLVPWKVLPEATIPKARNGNAAFAPAYDIATLIITVDPMSIDNPEDDGYG